MSKPCSGHFSGTTGFNHATHNKEINASNKENINNESDNLDLREHPVKKYSSTSIRKIRNKVISRTATKNEYKKLDQDRRLRNRRNTGVRNFWNQERERIINHQKPTRNWSAQQINDILAARTPKLGNRPLQGHHTYSVNKYPHLANKGELIFPVTFNEHLYGCHGGNFKNSLPVDSYKHIKKEF